MPGFGFIELYANKAQKYFKDENIFTKLRINHKIKTIQFIIYQIVSIYFFKDRELSPAEHNKKPNSNG